MVLGCHLGAVGTEAAPEEQARPQWSCWRQAGRWRRAVRFRTERCRGWQLRDGGAWGFWDLTQAGRRRFSADLSACAPLYLLQASMIEHF